MPGFYDSGDFDLVGFAVGIVEKSRIIDGRRVQAGDVLLGLASDGLHSNGFSLARKIVFDVAGLALDDQMPGCGRTVADELLVPTRLYAPAVLKVLAHYTRKQVVHGMAHVTGGGLVGNVPRVLGPGLRAEIRRRAWTVPPVFVFLSQAGGVADEEMWRVFNMGVGFVLAVSPYYADHVARILQRAGERVLRLGRVTRGPGEVVLK